MIQSVVILERTCEASQSVVIWEGTRIALDPNGGQVWGNLWSDRKSGHYGENMWRDPKCGHFGANVWSDPKCGHLRGACEASQSVVMWASDPNDGFVLGRTCGTVMLARTCETSQSVVICEVSCEASDPNGGHVWGGLVERSEKWSLWREHAE